MALFQRELNCGLRAVEQAARVTQDVAGRLAPDDRSQKADRSPVTVADYAAQAIVAKTIAAEFTADPIVGEESAPELERAESAAILDQVRSVLRDNQIRDPLAWISRAQGRPADRFWTLDPVDGTKGFLRRQQYAIALALIEQGVVRVAIMGCPNLPFGGSSPERGCIFYAVSQGGSFQQTLNGQKGTRLQVSRDNLRIAESVELAHADHPVQARIALALGIKLEPIRADSQVKYGLVARGDASVYLRLPNPETPDYRENIWDHAAGSLVVEEAGGTVTDTRGARLDFNLCTKLSKNRGLVASNGYIHQAVLEAIAQLA